MTECKAERFQIGLPKYQEQSYQQLILCHSNRHSIQVPVQKIQSVLRWFTK